MDSYIVLIISGVIASAVASVIFFHKNKKSTPLVENKKVDSELKTESTKKIFLEDTDPKIEVEAAVAAAAEVEVTVRQALIKTEESFFGRIRKALSLSTSTEVIDQVEEILYTSDLGPKTVQKLMNTVQDNLTKTDFNNIEKIKSALKLEIENILEPLHQNQVDQVHTIDIIKHADQGPTVIMILGVNGAGKTTSIGKITAQLASQNKKILVAAGDTFRAAAGGQLKVWTDRAQAAQKESGAVEIFWPPNVSDPAAIAFDAVSKAQAQNFDYVILDTAGRLHTQNHLMDELKKVKRVMSKVIPESPHNTWIVLDANSGQNALAQAIEFNKAMDLSGVILTKMDGTAKGGMAIGVVDNLQIPIKLIGIGEKINDLKVFNYKNYIDSILGRGKI